MEKIEGFVEEEFSIGKPKIRGFVIKGKIFEDVWGQNKKPIGFVKENEAYDNNQKYIGKVIYYQKQQTPSNLS